MDADLAEFPRGGRPGDWKERGNPVRQLMCPGGCLGSLTPGPSDHDSDSWPLRKLQEISPQINKDTIITITAASVIQEEEYLGSHAFSPNTGL